MNVAEDDEMSSVMRPRWTEDKVLDVKIQSTKEPTVVGYIGLGPEKIPTYSRSKTSNIDGEFLSNYCQGAFTKDGQCMCPAGAPRIATIMFIIEGEKTPLCGVCALVKSTPAAIRDNIVGMDDTFDVNDIVPPLTSPDKLEDFEVRGTIFPGFIGDKRLAINMEKLGLLAGFAAAFQDDNDNHVGRIYQELQGLGNIETNEDGETIKPSLFTEQLERGVLLTEKSDWWKIVGIIEDGVPALQQYFNLFYPKGNGDVAVMENGWLSYYLRKSVNLVGTVGEFDWHRDAGLTPDGHVDCRLVLTILNHADGTVHKRMYFVDRKTGCWFSFKCGHGYAVSMSQIVSGFRDGRFMHKIDGAEGTYAQVIQVSLSILI